MELAAEFFTLAYCQLHRATNQKHTDRWAYWLSIDLIRTLRDSSPLIRRSPASGTARDVLITSPLVAAPSPAPPVTPPPPPGTGQAPPPAPQPHQDYLRCLTARRKAPAQPRKSCRGCLISCPHPDLHEPPAPFGAVTEPKATRPPASLQTARLLTSNGSGTKRFNSMNANNASLQLRNEGLRPPHRRTGLKVTGDSAGPMCC